MKTNPQAGVLGHPIAHSLSPRLHGFWLKKYGLEGQYQAYDVAPENLGNFLKSLPEQSFKGVNLTVPHKEAALDLLDDVDELARKIGAVNTVVVKEDGSLKGTNTDGYGFLANLKQGAPQWQAPSTSAVIFGAGGAARALIVSLLQEGIDHIYLVNRTFERAEKLALELGGDRVEPLPWAERHTCLSEVNLLINSTTQGMTGYAPLDVNLERLPTEAVVTDIVYNPLDTPLLKAAKARGNPVVDGIGMLLHQAVPAFEAWFGVRPKVDQALRHHVLSAFAETSEND